MGLEALHVTADEVATGVATDRVHPEQDGVHAQHDRADADAPADTRLAKGLDGVDGQEHVEDETGVEEVAVEVLHDQGKPGLTAVLGVGVGDRTGGWREPERAVVTASVVVTREAKAQREDQDQQRRREPEPVEGESGFRSGHAEAADARRIERTDEVATHAGADEVVPVLEGSPRRIDDEHSENEDDDERLEPPAVASESRFIPSSAGATQHNLCRTLHSSHALSLSPAHFRVPRQS